MTCTCTLDGGGITLWDGTAFMSQCPLSSDQIALVHVQFGMKMAIVCGRITAVPVDAEEMQNYTSNATIPVDTSFNGTSIRCSVDGFQMVGMKLFMVGGK